MADEFEELKAWLTSFDQKLERRIKAIEKRLEEIERKLVNLSHDVKHLK